MTDAAVIKCVNPATGARAAISLSGSASVPGNAHAEDAAHSVCI